MSILSALKNNFLKSRVIGLTCKQIFNNLSKILNIFLDHFDRVLTQYSKGDLENPDEYFLFTDAMKFNELKFYSKLALNWKINPRYFNKYELIKYNEAVEKMKQFQEYQTFYTNMHDFYWELKILYLDLSREQSTPNIWNRKDYTTSQYVEDVKHSLKKYQTLLKQLEQYPEWHLKVKDEIGYQMHMIYTSLQHDDNFQSLFDTFDSHYYFK